MINVRRYSKGEEEVLRQICLDTTLVINVKEYGSELVHKWTTRLKDKSAWKEHVRKKNPFVAEIDSQLIGFAEFSTNGKIGAFYSHHHWQRKGVGTALLCRIETEAEKLGIENILVESSLSASKFFESKGFKVMREIEVYADGIVSKSIELVKSNANNKCMQSDHQTATRFVDR